MNLSLFLPRLPRVVLSNTRHRRNSVFPKFQYAYLQSPGSILCPRWVPRRFSVFGLLPVEKHVIPTTVQLLVHSFLVENKPLHASGQMLSALVLFAIFVGGPNNRMKPSGSLVRRIWKLVAPVRTSKRLTTVASVHIRLKALFVFASARRRVSMGFGQSHHLGHKNFTRRTSRCLLNETSTHGPRIFLYAAFFDSISFIFRFKVALGKRRWLQTTRNFERPTLRMGTRKVPYTGIAWLSIT